MRTSQTYDVAVIGGGPAGMMAAGRAAERGLRVILIEKNPGLGEKLLITGGGRCNILNAEFDARRLTEKYGKKGKTLFSVFSQFDAQAAWDFFEARGLALKIEAEKRAFPVTDNAADVHRVMVGYMTEHGVTVMTGNPVKKLEAAAGRITKIVCAKGSVTATHVILAVGGKSHPETGSTGDGFPWLRDLGHTVVEPDPALVPVTLADPWVKKVAGISLKSAKLTVMQGGKQHDARTGKMIFTHTGISGPLVLNMSKGIGQLLKQGEVTLALDLFPSQDAGSLDRTLQSLFEAGRNRMIRNSVGDIVQPRLGQALLAMTSIDTSKPLNQLSRDERMAFVRLLKHVPMTVKGLLGPEDAIVTGGGVLLKEVEFKTMNSKLVSNLSFAGDILDFDRPSGGFSLQICWTTGYVAGDAALRRPSRIAIRKIRKSTPLMS